MSRLVVALGEYDTGWHDPAGSLDRAEQIVRQSVARGAELVVLPEMCTTGFTMEPAELAEPLDGPSARRLRDIARSAGASIIAGIATRSDDASYNSAMAIDAEGNIAAEYRKQRLFSYAGEGAAYASGVGSCVLQIHGVRLGVFICFDLRFPELFRAVARDVDALVVIANWPAARRAHWDALLRARAIENQCYVVAVNRTGNGGNLQYDGGSTVIDPWGNTVARSIGAENPAICTIDAEVVERTRAEYPFLREMC